MATYGKGRMNRAIQLKHRPGQIITTWEKGKPHTIRPTGQRHPSLRSRSISENLRFPIGKWINKRNRKTGEPVVVLDWGCKDGKGITELAQKYGNKINAYGYSIDNHVAWTQTNFVKFIWNDPHRLLRYFKKESVDLIYSHFGIWKFLPQMQGISHTSPLTTNDSAGMIAYMRELGSRLKIGGVIVGHIEDGFVKYFRSVPWKEYGFRVRILPRFDVRDPYTRVKNSSPPRISIERIA